MRTIRNLWRQHWLACGIVPVIVLVTAGSSCGEEPPATAPEISDAVDVLLSWGKVALEAKRFAEAEARFREILDIDWNHRRAYELLLETRQRREETLAAWIRAGRSAEARHDYSLAEQHYQRVLDQDPSQRAARNGLRRARAGRAMEDLVQSGLDKYIMGDFPGAQEDFEKALEIDPSDARALAYRDRARRETTESSGLADLRSDEGTWARYLDALKKLRGGDLNGAEKLWRAILEKYPGNDAVLSNLEQIERRRREYSTQGSIP
jgi:tetratricopeptide (TPR) repeat protein